MKRTVRRHALLRILYNVTAILFLLLALSLAALAARSYWICD